MANFEHPSDDTVKLIDDVLLTVVDELLGVNVKILVDNKLKVVGTIKKLSPDITFSYGDDLQIKVNEIILERLPPIEQNMFIQELLAGVRWDYDSDKLVIDPINVKTYKSFLSKYDYPKYEVMIESIETLYEAKKQEDIEERERLKASGNAL